MRGVMLKRGSNVEQIPLVPHLCGVFVQGGKVDCAALGFPPCVRGYFAG